MGFIDWRDISNVIPGATGITIWFTSDYTVWAIDGNLQRYIYNTDNPKWITVSDNITQYDMSDYSYKDLETLAKTSYPIIGSARWNGTLVPNNQNGFVFLSNDTATLLSITGEIYRYNPHVNDTAWTKVR